MTENKQILINWGNGIKLIFKVFLINLNQTIDECKYYEL